MICPKCGATCPDDAKFCPACSNELNNTNEMPGVMPAPSVPDNAAPMPAPNMTEPTAAPMMAPSMPEQNATPEMPAQNMTQSMPDSQMNQMPNPGVVNGPSNEVPLVKEKKPFPLKLVLIIGGGVLLLIIIVVVLLIVLKNPGKAGEDEDKLNAVFGLNTPILIQENGKYGYIDTSGKKVIAPQFVTAKAFHGDFAYACGDEVSSENCFIIDAKGKKRLNVKYLDDVEYDDETGYWNIAGVLYDSKLKQLSPDGLKVEDSIKDLAYLYDSDKTVGLLDPKGKLIYSYDKGGDSYVYFSIDCGYVDEKIPDTYCRVNIENEKYGVINIKTGKMIVDYVDHYIFTDDYNVFKESNKDYSLIRRFYIQGDKIVYEATSSDVSFYHISGRPYIEIYDSRKGYGERYSYIDVNTGLETTEKPTYEEETKGDEWEEYTSYTKFSCNAGNGVMSGDKILIKCEWPVLETPDLELYKFLKSNGKELIFAVKDDKYNILDLKTGNTLATFNTDDITTYKNSTFITYKEGNDTKFVYNLVTGKSISVSSDTDITIGSNYVKVDMGREKDYYNANMEVIYTESKVSTVS